MDTSPSSRERVGAGIDQRAIVRHRFGNRQAAGRIVGDNGGATLAFSETPGRCARSATASGRLSRVNSPWTSWSTTAALYAAYSARLRPSGESSRPATRCARCRRKRWASSCGGGTGGSEVAEIIAPENLAVSIQIEAKHAEVGIRRVDRLRRRARQQALSIRFQSTPPSSCESNPSSPTASDTTRCRSAKPRSQSRSVTSPTSRSLRPSSQSPRT